MAWTMKNGHAYNTTTGVSKVHDRTTVQPGVSRRGHERTTGTMHAHREAKRVIAEETPHKARTAEEQAEKRADKASRKARAVREGSNRPENYLRGEI